MVVFERGDREEWSDGDLLAAVARSDGPAFTEFYQRHLPIVVAFLRRSGCDREVAADLAAETFAGVLGAARRYRPERATAAPWVIAIARNKLLESRRRGRVADQARRRLGYQPVALDDNDLERVDEIAAAGATGLAALLDALPAAERDAIRARVLDEREYEQIAFELRCSELVVRKRVSRGLARLREQLKET